MVTQFFLSFFKTFLDFYVETFCLGKVTEASLSGLELPGLEELELALIVLRALGRLKHLSFPKRWSSSMMLSSTGSSKTFGQLMVGQVLLYLVCAPRSFAVKAACSVESLERGLKSYSEPLDY